MCDILSSLVNITGRPLSWCRTGRFSVHGLLPVYEFLSPIRLSVVCMMEMAHCTLVRLAARNLFRRSFVFPFGNLVWDNLTQISLVIAMAKPFATLRNIHGFTVERSHDCLPSLTHSPRSIPLLLPPSALQYRYSPPISGGYVLVHYFSTILATFYRCLFYDLSP